MSEKPRKKLDARVVISALLSFFMSLLLSAFVLVFLINITVLNPSFLKNQVDNSGYVATVAVKLRGEMTAYGIPGGFSESFMSGIVDERNVRLDIFGSIDNLYSREAAMSRVGIFKENIYGKLRENVMSSGVELTSESEESLMHLAGICAAKYDESVSFPWQSHISRMLLLAKRLILTAIIVTGGVLPILALCMLSLHKSRTKRYRYFIYSLTAASANILIPVLLMTVTGGIRNISITDKAMYHLLLACFSGVMGHLLLSAMVLIAATAGLSLLYLRHMKVRRYRK
ncbi:MAG: hypothetical protein FWH14_03725 [Oscillospiraceae bacterium]|nr:hypothetical protein [Oscillospiraceae bacterium]